MKEPQLTCFTSRNSNMSCLGLRNGLRHTYPTTASRNHCYRDKAPDSSRSTSPCNQRLRPSLNHSGAAQQKQQRTSTSLNTALISVDSVEKINKVTKHIASFGSVVVQWGARVRAAHSLLLHSNTGIQLIHPARLRAEIGLRLYRNAPQNFQAFRKKKETLRRRVADRSGIGFRSERVEFNLTSKKKSPLDLDRTARLEGIKLNWRSACS